MTSLQKQLQQIGTADLRNVTEGSRKYKASFVSDSREAADQDLETIFAIAQNGILELQQLDPAFEPFEKTLFSESIKNVDRVLRTREENDKVDASINAFMRRLSPYFLLRPAGKVLEWLIRRFRIHEFNVDAVMLCILPYHETKSFVKMVSLLRLGDSSMWKFLIPIKKSQLGLMRQQLIEAMLKTSKLTEFICNMVVHTDAPYSGLYSFFAATIIEYVRCNISEDKIRHLIPFIVDGLGDREHSELQIACYMIVSQLVSITQLRAEAVQLLVDEAIVRCRKRMLRFCLMMVVHAAQTQPSLSSLGKKTYNRMAKMEAFDSTFLEIAETYACDRFLSCLIPDLCERKSTQLLEHAIARGLMSSFNIRMLCQRIIDGYLDIVSQSKVSEKGRQKYMSTFQPLLTAISQRHVDDLDMVLKNKLDTATDVNDKRAHALYEFTSLAFKGTRHEIIMEEKTTLFLCLMSPSASARLLAVKRLVNALGEDSSVAQSSDMIESALANSLTDFNDLLQYAIGDAAEHVLDRVPSSTIISNLEKLLHGRGAEMRKESVAVLQFSISKFLKKFPDLHDRVARLLVLFVFSAPHANIKKLLQKAKDDKSFEGSRLIDDMLRHAKEAPKESRASSFLLLQGQNMEDDHLVFWLDMLSSEFTAERSVALLVLARAVATVEGKRQYLFASKVLSTIATTASLAMYRVYEGGYDEHMVPAENGLPPSAILEKLQQVDDISTELLVDIIKFALRSMIMSIKHCNGVANWFVSTENTIMEAYKQVMRDVFKVMTGGPSLGMFEPLLATVVSSQLKEDLGCFLTHLWCSSDINDFTRARALQVMASFILHSTGLDVQHVLPSVLYMLENPDPVVRHTAAMCLASLEKRYNAVQLPYGAALPGSGHHSKTHGQKLSILSAEVFYGPGHSVGSLSSNDAAHIVEYLSQRKEEMEEDSKRVCTLLNEYIAQCDASTEKSIRSRKNRLVDFLLAHIQATPSTVMQVGLLELLDPVESPHKLQKLEPMLVTQLKQQDANIDLIRYLVRCFQPCCVTLFKTKSGTLLSLFLRLLAVDENSEDTDSAAAVARQYALMQVTNAFFEQAPPMTQQLIFQSLINVVTNGQQRDIQIAKQALSNIRIAAKMLEGMLVSFAREMIGAPPETEPSSAAKRVRRSSVSKIGTDLYELVTILELIECRRMLDDNLLIKPLFELLTALVNADLREVPVSLEYINQLIMSSLTRAMQTSDVVKAHIDESSLRVDVVVQCIRVTSNPQTHNQALLLMASIATVYPESVLHNIMPVFTFMGANVLRQDDNYSFQVIQQTLEKIIPPLVASRRLITDSNDALALQVKPVIKVFVDALFHIPKHRRLRLFEILVQTLGQDNFLYTIVVLLLDKLTEKQAKGYQSDAESLLEFALMISHKFSPATQVKTVLFILQELLAVPNDKPADDDQYKETLFNAREHTAKQLRQFKLATLQYIGKLLSSKEYLVKVTEEADAGIDTEQELQPLYREVIELLLRVVTSFTDTRDQCAMSSETHPTVARYWRMMVKEVYEVLKKVNALLPLPAFIQTIVSLIERPDAAVRRKAMTMFDDKVTSFKGKVPTEAALLMTMVGHFSTVIQREPNTLDEYALVNKQTALQCITSLASLAGDLFPSQFADAIPVVMGESAMLLNNDQIKVSSAVCFTVVCREIGPRVIPHMPKFMPVLLNILQTSIQKDQRNAVLQQSIVHALGACVDALPQFITPYIPKMLHAFLDRSVYAVNPSAADEVSLCTAVKDVLETMGAKIPSRKLLDPLFTCFQFVVEQGKESLLALVSMLSQVMMHVSLDDMTFSYKKLFKFFLMAFDIRRQHYNVFSEEDLDTLEKAIIDAFLSMVVKLNETLFKPLFLKVVDWATIELWSDDQVALEPRALDRVTLFYRLTDALLEKLKSIFTPYYAYAVEDTLRRLVRYANGTDEPDRLWSYLMNSLRKSFLYDQDNLWNASTFEKILDPVVDQLMNTASGDASDYQARMSSYVVPCIGQMAVTVSNDVLWKPLNHKVLMKTREDNPEIRLGALKCIEELYERLGDEWLLFLPESISFLAELMEDDDSRVEHYVHQVNAKIEVYLGESMDKFFTQ